MKKEIKILIIDDSALVRKILKQLFSSDPELKIVGIAHDPFEAAVMMREEKPDVITLDIEMPKMDGLTFLQKLMSQHPIPVVVLSSLTEGASVTGLKALEYGAVEILDKPKINLKSSLENGNEALIRIVKEAAQAKVQLLKFGAVKKVLRKGSILWNPEQMTKSDRVICLGASAGGTQALKSVLQDLPSDFPGILVVQHMPKEFTRQFAASLNHICAMEVVEAQHGDRVENGKVFIAPGGRHMLLKKDPTGFSIQIKDGPRVSMHRPSVDVLFKSAASHAGKKAIGVIMTGMGRDGALGLAEMKISGAMTVAQNEESCVVFGMPKEAIKLDAVHAVCHLKEIPLQLEKWVKNNQLINN